MTSADQDYRSRRVDGRRGPAHARTSPRWPDPSPAAYPADYHQAEYYQPEQQYQPQPQQYQPQPEYYQPQPEYPGWAAQTARQDDYADWNSPSPAAPADDLSGWAGPPGYHGDHPDPGWPAQAPSADQYPVWTGQPAAPADRPGWTEQHHIEYPAEAGVYGQYDLHPDHPSWPESQFAPWPGPPQAGGYGSPGRAVAPPLPERVPPPYAPAPDFPPRADAPHVLAPGRDMPLHRDMNFADANFSDANFADASPGPMNYHAAPVTHDTITDVANWASPTPGTRSQPASRSGTPGHRS